MTYETDPKEIANALVTAQRWFKKLAIPKEDRMIGLFCPTCDNLTNVAWNESKQAVCGECGFVYDEAFQAFIRRFLEESGS